jgi:uncharacterized protein YfaS (alpha-2-macroglobulin family)/TolA-binding protein
MFGSSEWRCVWVVVVLATWWCPTAGADDHGDLAIALVPEELRQLVQDRDWPAALQALDRELQQPDALADRLLFLRGRILYYQEQYDAAVTALREVEQRFPASPWSRRARFAAALALAKQSNFQAAGQIYRNEADVLVSPERAGRTADLYSSYAEASFDPDDESTAPDYATALNLYEKALGAGPQPDRRLDIELRVARCNQLLKQPSEAVPRYAAIVRAHPEAPQALEAQFRLGECHMELGGLLQARLAWQDLLATHGTDPSPWLAEASFQLSRTWGLPTAGPSYPGMPSPGSSYPGSSYPGSSYPGMPAPGLPLPGMPATGTDEQLLLGVEALRDFIERFPAHGRVGEAYLIMAEGYLARERFADAARTLEEFLSDERRTMTDQAPRVRQRLGFAYLQLGRLADAAKTWKEFLAKHPSDSAWSEVQRQVIDTEYLMAANERDAGQFDTARQMLREFLAQYPLDSRAPEVLWLFGQMSFQQAAWEDAINQWRQLVSKYPTTEEAARARYQIAEVLAQKLGRPRDALLEYKQIVAGEFASLAREAELRITTPSLAVTTPRVFRSHELPHLELTTRNVRSVTFRLYRLNLESYFRKVFQVGGVEQLDIGLIDPDASVTFEIPDYEDFREIVTHPEMPFPNGVARGAVAITASCETSEVTTLVLQSDLEIIVQADRNNLLVFAENLQTGQPWPGVKLLMSDGQRVFAEAATGDDGVFQATYAELADCPDVRVVALCEGHVASQVIGLEGLDKAPALADKAFLHTDRPVYYAGDTVHVRGCIHRAVDGKWTIESERGLTFEVYDSRDRQIHREPVALSSFGTFETQFRLPATSQVGPFRIQACDDAGHVYQGTFQVAECREEPIQVSIDLPKAVYCRGEDVTGTIRVAYRYGEPLVDQLVHYQLLKDREYTARTNERGEVPFTLPTRNFFADQTLELSVKLPDQKVERKRPLSLVLKEFAAEVTTTRDVYLANEEFPVMLATRDAVGKPVSQPLTLEVRRFTKVGGVDVEQFVEDHAVTTGETDGIARVNLQLGTTGQYRLRVRGEDGRGNSVSGQRDLAISGEDDPQRLRILVDDHAWRVGDRAEVILHWREKPALCWVTFQAEQVCEYRLVPLQTGPNVLPIELDKRLAPRLQLNAFVVLDSRTEPGDSTANTTANVSANTATSPRLHTAECALNVTDALQVTLSHTGQGPDKNVVRPGQPVEITIRTTDSQGRPAPAEVSLAMIEEVTPGDRRSDNEMSHSVNREGQAVRWNTAYSSAAIVTDDTGVATVTVQVPRRLAIWKLVAEGISRESLAGETSATIRSEQDLFGELKVPAALVPGDETEAVGVIHNLRSEPVPVEARLAMRFAGQTVEQTQTVTVNAGGRQEVRFPLACPVAELVEGVRSTAIDGEPIASLLLTLTGGDQVDTAEWTIPVQSQVVVSRSAVTGAANSNRSVTVAPPERVQRESLRLRVMLRTNVKDWLWNTVMLAPYGIGYDTAMATTDSLSSDLMSVVGVQSLFELSTSTKDVRTRQLAERIRRPIAELVSSQRGDGGWSWSLSANTSDRYATARVVWALSLARRAGHHVPEACLQQATEYLTRQVADTASDDLESKAILLHALSVAGNPDFPLGNRLHRERAQASMPALLYLALALIEMDRKPMAAEVLSLCEQRVQDIESGTASALPAPLAAQAPNSEWLALRALALTIVAPDAEATSALMDLVLTQRQGLRWVPDRGAGPAVLAFCHWFDQHRQVSPNGKFKVSINNRPADTCVVPDGIGEFELIVPADQLVDGDQRVAIEPAGPGRYLFEVECSGVSSVEPLQTTTQAWGVTRTYAPAPRESSGSKLRRGFGIVRNTSQAFVNPLSELPVGQRAEIELLVQRHAPTETPLERLDYLIVTEPIPSGVVVLPETIRGPHEYVAVSPNALTFYLGQSRSAAVIHYEVVGQYAGATHAAGTVVWNAYRSEERAVAEPKRLRVLPHGSVSTDPYRWSPEELFELGKQAYSQHDWPRAESFLTPLLDEWSLEPDPYRETVEMLLDVAIELGKSDRVVRYFEIVFEQWPDKVIALDKVVRIGSAYQELGEAERSFQVFRAAVEGAFVKEAGVAGVLLGMGQRVPSAQVVQHLLCEYPPEPYVATAHLALAQQIATWATDVEQDSRLRAAGFQSSDLVAAAWRMQEDYLVEYPLAPNADRAAFSAANALLESKDFARAAIASQRYAVRYPDSQLLDDFWFMAGYCHFVLGEFEPAIEMLRNVAAGKFNQASGPFEDDDNKWSAVYVLGQIYHSLGRVAEALQEYQMVEDRFPDAKASLASFLREGIRLPELTTVRPGKPVEVELTYRNVPTCDLKVYRIDLAKFAVLLRTLTGIRDINLAGIEPHREMTVALGEGKDYRDLKRMLPLELSEEGAYLIVCRGGSQFASGLVLVSSLELEVYRVPRTSTVRVTLKDVTNDQYVHGAEVKVIGAGKSQMASGLTDRRGLFVAEGILGTPTVIATVEAGKCALYRPLQSLSPGLNTVPGNRPAVGGDGVRAAVDLLNAEVAPQATIAGGVILAGPGLSPGDQRIQAILETRTALKFEETPLTEVAQQIMQQHDFTILIDRRALDDVGLGSDTPVTFDGGDLSLGAALTLILDELELTYVVQHEVLRITTPEEGENELTTVAYPITELTRFRDPDGTTWSDFDTLINTITSTVSPETWEDVGGAGAIEPMPVQDKDVLVISQTQSVQRDIAAVLERLRTIANGNGTEGELPVRARPEGGGGNMPSDAGGFGGAAGMGGMGGQAESGGSAMSAPGPAPMQYGHSPASTPAGGAELLRGLEATKRRLQGEQVDNLQRLYEQGKGGMGGVGAGGFF